MLTLKMYNQEGTAAGEVNLAPRIFGLPIDPRMVQQAVVNELSNKRQGNAHTKTRGEVRGGGIKPWKQKGTGRARHGSIRSPIWIGGGVAFGPRNDRNYQKKMTTKARRKALFMALSAKVIDGKFMVIDNLHVSQVKTKQLNAILKKLSIQSKSILMIIGDSQKNLFLSGRNIPDVQIIRADSLNVYDVMRHEIILIDQISLPIIENTYTS